MLKRLLSYIVPINIHQQKSAVSKNLEVTWNNGELVLDSKNTNYSYGSLQRILRKGLLHIGAKRILEMQHILVLGVAGGSVIRTLTDELKYANKITGVEIDQTVVELANTYFGLNKILNLEVVIDDAFEFVLKTKERYDLVIIDIFKDTDMPNFLFEKFFFNRLAHLLNHGGYILFNTMTLNGMHDQRNRDFLSAIPSAGFEAQTIPRVENHNELIVIKKL
ncbi:MAG TPA: fused MFS/spermidine synthase [Flavobacterium sp.]|jgi:spermidine synthase